MRVPITMHTVDFEIEVIDGELDGIYIGGQEVTQVISDLTRDALRCAAEAGYPIWRDEYLLSLAHEQSAELRSNYDL